MLSEDGRIQQNHLEELNRYSDFVECECPAHLIDILLKVREFEAYTTECITKFPKDANTHRWLKKASQNVDALLSNTIVQLARIEGFIDEENKFVPRDRVARKNDQLFQD
jgi:hypothetical protein